MDIYDKVFRPFKLSRTDFALFTQNSKVVGIGPGDFVFSEGDTMNQDSRYVSKIHQKLAIKILGCVLFPAITGRKDTTITETLY